MCARFTVLSDTPIAAAIAGCAIPLSRNSTIWMRWRCAAGIFHRSAVFSRRTSALLHLTIRSPESDGSSESHLKRGIQPVQPASFQIAPIHAVMEVVLDIVDLQDLPGLVGRHPWLSLGRVPEGRYDLVQRIPPNDKVVPQVNTLIVTSPCAKRANRIELLALLSAELPRFVRSNPPNSTSSATHVSLSSEARQFFLTGEPEFADRYFPWLVNVMSPAYWVYLVMAVTAIFNGLKGLSRFWLWRIDAAREKIEAEVRQMAGDVVSHGPTRHFSSNELLIDQKARAAAQDILSRLAMLRARCERRAKSFATPMGDEMFYRYQQSLMDDTTAVLERLLGRPLSP